MGICVKIFFQNEQNCRLTERKEQQQQQQQQ